MLSRDPERSARETKKQQIIAPLGVDDTSEWCNSFMLICKANGKVRLHLDPARLNKVLIRPVHRDLMLNDILPRLAVVTNLMLMDVSLGYHNLTVGGKSSYLTVFSCPFGRYT